MPSTRPGPVAVSVRISDGFGELPGLRSDWQRLFGARGNEPSTSFEWTEAMVRHHLRPDDRGFLLRLERRGDLVGIVPLVCRRFRILGQTVGLLMPIAEDYNTHSDLLLASADQELVEAVVDALFALDASWDCFRMARLLDLNTLNPLLIRSLDVRCRAHSVRGGLAAYVLDLPSTYEDYLNARSAKFRNHLKRTERKLSAAGRVEVHVLDNAAAFDQAFDALLQVERSSWKQSFGTAITAVSRQMGFYRDMARGAMATGRLHLQWLTFDRQPVAYNLGYVTSAGYHYLKTSYDHDYRQLGPATVLRARLIQSLIAANIPRLDFPGEPYAWESQWTTTVRRRVVLSIYRPTLRGRLLSVIDRVKHRRSRRDGVEHVDPRAAHGGRRQESGAAA